MFAFLSDPTHWMLAIPHTEVPEVSVADEGVGTTATWSARILGIPAAAVHEYTESVPNERIVSKASSGFVLTFTLAPEGDTTRLTLDQEWPGHLPVAEDAVRSVVLRATGHDLDTMLANVRAALETDADWRDTYAERAKLERVVEFTRSVTIAAPVEKVFGITEHPQDWFGAYPGSEITGFKAAPEGVGTTFHWTERVFGIPLGSGTHACTEYVPHERFVTKSSAGPVFAWTFRPVEGGTELTLRVVETGLNLAQVAVDTLVTRLSGHAMETWLADLEQALEGDGDWRAALAERRQKGGSDAGTDPTWDFDILIGAPVHTVFEYCRDPRRIYAGDPTHEVPEATVTAEGVGTTARVVVRGVLAEEIMLEYVEVVPDERIVFNAYPKVIIAGMQSRPIPIPTHVWAWTFTPEDGGTRLGVVVVEKDPARWQRALDRLDKGFVQQIRDRLDRVRSLTEELAAPAVPPG